MRSSKSDSYFVEPVDSSEQVAMIQFLREREDYTLFLLYNFASHGPKLTAAPYSGNFKLIYAQEKIVGVFCLTRSGAILIETTIKEPIFEMVLMACQEERIALKGLIGDWNFCAPFWEFLKKKKVIQKEISFSKEVLYRIDVLQVSLPVLGPNIRFLSEDDYEQWKPLRFDFLTEKKLPNTLNDEQLWEAFQEKVKKKIGWGFFLKEQLISMADLTAVAFGMGQLGGVYTIPSMRQKGYARAVLQQILFDLKHAHKLHKLIIFTEEHCFAPQKLYESLGAVQIGHYALLFGTA